MNQSPQRPKWKQRKITVNVSEYRYKWFKEQGSPPELLKRLIAQSIAFGSIERLEQFLAEHWLKVNQDRNELILAYKESSSRKAFEKARKERREKARQAGIIV